MTTERQKERRSRKRLVRSRVISVRRLTKRDQKAFALEAGPTDHDRPKTRGDCLAMERPCPFVGCRYHLFLDVTPTGIKLNFPDLEVEEMAETCALDVADQDGMTLEHVGELLNVTRERIRMIEVQALAKVLGEHELDDHSDNRDGAKRRVFAFGKDAA